MDLSRLVACLGIPWFACRASSSAIVDGDQDDSPARELQAVRARLAKAETQIADAEIRLVKSSDQLRDSRREARRLRLRLNKATAKLAVLYEERLFLGKVNALNHRRLEAAIKQVALTDEVDDVQQPPGLLETMPQPFSEFDRR